MTSNGPTRRELLTGVLGLGTGAWACRQNREAEWEGADVVDGREWGHALRDPVPPDPLEPTAAHEVVVVGGGIAGLMAAWRLMRSGLRDVVVLEGHYAPGGTSRGGESKVTPYPWGAHYVPMPSASQPHLRSLLAEMGALRPGPEGELEPIEAVRITEPVERTFHRGQWHPGLYPFSSRASRDQLARFRRAVDGWVRFRDDDGRRAFTLPLADGSDDPKVRALDEMTFAEWLDREGFDDPGLRWYVRYASRDDYGTEPEDLSAWYGLAYFAARASGSSAESAPFLSWPNGNARIVDHLVRVLGTWRVRTGQVVTRVEGRGGRSHARVIIRGATGRRWILAARWVVFASPSYVRLLVLPDAPGSYRPDYAPWLVSNVHLDHRPDYVGFETAWDNVFVDSESLGYVVATHQGGSAFGPTVWTHYRPFSERDAKGARERLRSLSWDEASEAVYLDLRRGHPDLARHLRRIDVLRWGHGMVRPEPGLAFDRDRIQAARPVDGIHFAHTDLSGAALLEEAAFHGVRAADAILAERRTESP